MTLETVSHESLSKSFTLALLLTGSAEQAEAAVSESIELLDFDNASADAIVKGTVNASVRFHRQQTREQDSALTKLPPELRRVSQLSDELRPCFVLRFLAGYSQEVCARLLRLKIHQVDEVTSRAAKALPQLT